MQTSYNGQKGQITKIFDGDMTDEKTGEVKHHQPSVTVFVPETGEEVKVKLVDASTIGKFKMGQMVTITGMVTKAATLIRTPAEALGSVELAK